MITQVQQETAQEEQDIQRIPKQIRQTQSTNIYLANIYMRIRNNLYICWQFMFQVELVCQLRVVTEIAQPVRLRRAIFDVVVVLQH